jgi:two-component system sensor histidine kinase/response regulator
MASQDTLGVEFVLAIMDHLAHPIFVKDRAFRFVLVNQALCEMIGRSREEIIGTTDYDHFPKSEADFFRKKDTAIFSEGKRIDIEEEPLTDADGNMRYLATTKVPLKSADGELTHLVGIIQDITERKKSDAAMLAARSEAEKATRAKTAFLAHVSHEIRTPMHGILGMTQLLKKSGPSREQEEFIDTIHKSANALLNMLNDILDVSKIESGHFELEHSRFDIEELIFEVLEVMAEKANHKSIELFGGLPEGFPRTLVGDVSRLRQVLLNLVSNAVKFTPHGEVSVDVHLVPSPDGEDIFLFDVSDSGPGIAQEDLPQIFEAYINPGKSHEEGTGLGLSISRQIVEAMGGRIWVNPRNPHGSVFSFEVPLKVASEIVPIPNRSSGSSGNAVVVMENRLSREELAGRLDTMGFSVQAYRDLDAIPSVAPGPGGDALTVFLDTAVMRTQQDWERMPPAWDSAHRKILLRPFGASAAQPIPEGWELLHRPIRPSRLHQMLGHRAEGDADGGASGGPETHQGQLGRVLLVEDNPVSQRVTELLLVKMGYDVTLAPDGQSALKHVRDSDYRAILMDCRLPDIDGFEVTRRIRRGEGKNPEVPILALTASTAAQDKEKCLDAGMDDFLGKPIEWNDLEARLARWARPLPKPSDAGE